MVFFTPNPRRVLEACWRVDVIKGGFGFEDVGRSSLLETTIAWVFNTSRAVSTEALLFGLTIFPY